MWRVRSQFLHHPAPAFRSLPTPSFVRVTRQAAAVASIAADRPLRGRLTPSHPFACSSILAGVRLPSLSTWERDDVESTLNLPDKLRNYICSSLTAVSQIHPSFLALLVRRSKTVVRSNIPVQSSSAIMNCQPPCTSVFRLTGAVSSSL